MYFRLSLLLVLLLPMSCNKTEESEKADIQETGTYFSIIEYVKDQWSTYHGQAFAINKRVYLNGKADSTYTNTLDMDWASVFKTFFNTDIGEKKYIGQYEFSQFRDDATMTNNFYYEAKNDKLYTKKLHIMANYYTDRITSIYIEAEKDTRLGTKTVKLFYVPLDVISIQEEETSRTGEKKDLRIEYDFI